MGRKEPAHEIDHRVGWLMSLGCPTLWGRKARIDVNDNPFFTFPVTSFVIMPLSSSLWLMLEKQLVLHTELRCSLCSELLPLKVIELTVVLLRKIPPHQPSFSLHVPIGDVSKYNRKYFPLTLDHLEVNL